MSERRKCSLPVIILDDILCDLSLAVIRGRDKNKWSHYNITVLEDLV